MAEQFELREREIFRIFEKIKKFSKIVLVGGYALNAYTEFPRFSVDCDLVVQDGNNTLNILTILKKEKFKTIEEQESFVRLERRIDNSKVGIDLLIGKIIDRLSGIVFEFSDIFQESKIMELVAKSNPELKTNFRVASPEVLFLMKFASLRKQDIRDIFMLSSHKLNKSKIKNLIKKHFSDTLFNARKEELKKLMMSKGFTNSLQGVYGKLPEEFVEKNKRLVMTFVNF